MKMTIFLCGLMTVLQLTAAEFIRLGVSTLPIAAQMMLAEDFPSADELCKALTSRHPRLFLAPDGLPAFKAYANLPQQKFYLDEAKKEADESPETPRLAPSKFARIEDGKFKILKSFGNQNMIWDYLDDQSYYGRIACRCAITYLATGDRKYLAKAQRYLASYPQLIALAREQKIMIEWYHTDRLAALVTYDWLYNELDPQVRKQFISALIDYSVFINGTPGYITNSGPGWDCGNYGEYGFLWPLCLCTMHDPDADQAKVAKLYAIAYKNERDTMTYREKMSAGTGLLTSPCSGYCFGYYPYASYNFLHTLKSAAGIDGTKYFPQMRDYAKYFDWMSIPGTGVKGKPWLMDFAWGDSFHTDNSLELWQMYNHLAQLIHFFGKSDPQIAAEARTAMNKLPEDQRMFRNRHHYPFLPFLLTDFHPQDLKGKAAPPDPRLANFFRSYGLVNIRSGVTAQDTHISIKAGAMFQGHSHFDELAFVIYKDGFLSASTGCRDGAPHHQAYYAQTIAHNSPLIRMEDEPLPRHWYGQNQPKFDFDSLRCDGGQNRKCAARNLGVEQSAYHVVTAGDATQCYSELKCKEAVRQFVFIKPDYLVIYDRLTSVRPDQQKVFVLHTQNELSLSNGVWSNTEFHGKLFTKTVLPETVQIEIIGGPGREYWTNNQNFHAGKIFDHTLKRRNFLGRYRLEVSPAEKACSARMLHVLQAAKLDEKSMVPVEKIADREFDGVKFTTREGITVTVRFRRNGLVGGSLKLEKDGKVLLERPLLKPAAVAMPQPESGAASVPAAVSIAIPNGDLEKGIQSWLLYGTDGKFPDRDRKLAIRPEAGDVHAGKGAMRIADTCTDYRTYVVNPVEICAGKYKTVTVKAWVKGVKGKSFRLGMLFHKRENGTWKCLQNCVKTLPVPNEWKEYSATFSVPADADGVFALIGAASMEMADTGEILVDDVTMTGEAK